MMNLDLLKENAKKALSNNYWLAVGVTIIASIISGTASSISAIPQRITNTFTYAVDDISDLTGGLIIVALFMSLISMSLNICISIFVNNVIHAGQCAFYLKLRKGISDFGALFFALQNGNYMKVVKVMLKKFILVFLWTLLFIIPGIIKSYEYFMVDYLAAENPDIDPERALQISSKTMDGHKMDLFCLHLSFIGWWLLVLLTCGIGSYFLTPYVDASLAEFYEFMKARAINENIARPEEFGIPALQETEI